MSEQPQPEWGEDATSGRKFVRWNAISLLLGVALVGVGWAFSRPSGARFDPSGLGALPRWQNEREVTRYRLSSPGEDGATLEVTRLVQLSGEAWETVALTTLPSEGSYSPREQESCRLSRDDPRLVLEATRTTQHWPQLDSSARWEGQREGGVWLRAQLPFALRVLDWSQPGVRRVTLAGIGGRGAPQSAQISVHEQREEVVVPAGSFSCYRVSVTRADAPELTFWIGVEPERPLVQFEGGAGRGRLVSRSWEAKN